MSCLANAISTNYASISCQRSKCPDARSELNQQDVSIYGKLQPGDGISARRNGKDGMNRQPLLSKDKPERCNVLAALTTEFSNI